MVLNEYEDTHRIYTISIHIFSLERIVNGVRASGKMCAVFHEIRISESLKNQVYPGIYL